MKNLYKLYLVFIIIYHSVLVFSMLLISFGSCKQPEKSMLNHKGAVVLRKGKRPNQTAVVKLRSITEAGYYVVTTMTVPTEEFDLFNIGDTIK